MNRRKCRKQGHRFRGVAGAMLPYEFCTRWFCPAARVAGWVPPETATYLAEAIPEDER
jgi:hypothetical protein